MDIGQRQGAQPPSVDTIQSISSSVAGERLWDAVVVGAGVAGATIARLLARRGHRVLLVERKAFPRYKVCGCCLNQRSLRLLDEAGVTSALYASGAQALDGVRLIAGRKHADLRLPGGLAVSRNNLDLTLARAAEEAGARILFGAVATLDSGDSSGLQCVALQYTGGAGQVRARLVVAADGLAGKLVREPGGAPKIARSGYVGLGALALDGGGEVPQGRIHMLCGRTGYAGYVRVENNNLAVGAAVHPSALRAAGGPGACIHGLFQELGQAAPVELNQLSWTGTPVLTRQSRRVGQHRLVTLGDAAGYVEPFTGEGMAWALEGAHHLDKYLGAYSPAQWDVAATGWDRAYREFMVGRRLWCRALSTALRFPTLTAASVRLLARMPFLSAPVITALNRTSRS